MRVAVRHATRLDYTVAVVEGIMDARLGPLSDADQRWDSFDLRINPSAAVRPYTDGFDNAAHLITISRAHQFIELVAESRVETLLDDPFVPPLAPPRPLRPSELADYLAPSTMVPREPELEAMASPYRAGDPAAAFEAVRQLMDLIYRGFRYQQYVTSVATTVAEVLRERTGVCQDFAHVLLGLCRSIGIPARYVSGYIVHQGHSQHQSSSSQTQSQSQSQSQSSGVPHGPSAEAGASHAWIEAYTPTHGWRGFDPTNNLVASQDHIKMAIGRDYGDVPPTRGTFRGVAEEHLSVEVITRVLE